LEKILLTGVAGFIGFHTIQKLIKQNFFVIGIDDINNHYDPFLKKQRLAFLKKNFKNRFLFKKIDIRDTKKIDDLLKKNKFKAIINLAARAGVKNSLKYPHIYYETNVIGLLNILNGLKKYQPDTLLIQASTS